MTCPSGPATQNSRQQYSRSMIGPTSGTLAITDARNGPDGP
jgi:hypothetical protein